MMNNRDKLGYFELASKPILEIKEIFKVKVDGFKENEANQIRNEYGDNEIDYGTEKSLWRYIFEAYFTPFTLVLLSLALISFLTDYVFVEATEREILGPIIIVVLINKIFRGEIVFYGK